MVTPSDPTPRRRAISFAGLDRAIPFKNINESFGSD